MSEAVTANGRHPVASPTPLVSVFVATFAWGIIASIALGLVAMIVVAPLLQSSGQPQVASTIYKVFSYVCHQIPERSFHLAGHQFAVCSRCTGLYSGFAVATLIYPLVRSLRRTDSPRRLWLILSAVPLLIDFSLTYFGIWSNTHATRFATGALLGAVAAFYVLPGMIELSFAISRRFNHNSSEKRDPTG